MGFFDDVGRGIGGFANKESKNVGDYGVLGAFLGSEGAGTVAGGTRDVTKGTGGLLGGAGGLFAGLGKGAASPVMWIALAGAAATVMIFMMRPRPAPAPAYYPPPQMPR